jgi:predicted aspartyl protease
MTYKFRKDPLSGMILVFIQVNENHEFKMMLDTGASNTTFDINPLYIADYPIDNIIKTCLVETSNGIMEVDVIKTSSVSAFGHTVKGLNVQIYDFHKHGILSDYDGLLGLDFFENTKFCIDMKNQTIEVNAHCSTDFANP